MEKSFNVIITTVGRPSLKRMLRSVAPQLQAQDYLTIISDASDFGVDLRWTYANCKASIILIRNANKLGYGGHASRTKWQQSLPGDYHMHADDDDVYEKDALHWVRMHCTERKLYLFRFVWAGGQMWREEKVKAGNLGTPNGVFPPIPGLPVWDNGRGGDGRFYERLSQSLPVEFIDRVIYRARGARKEPVTTWSRLWENCTAMMRRITARARRGVFVLTAKRWLSLGSQSDRHGRPIV